ncbi:hypothetical protein TNCV_5075001 [Trichonephila clavipes]|nr:hypothetical protein TNCV_5075001 [Trichonephila clavipes]
MFWIPASAIISEGILKTQNVTIGVRSGLNANNKSVEAQFQTLLEKLTEMKSDLTTGMNEWANKIGLTTNYRRSEYPFSGSRRQHGRVEITN